jgi:hypothetical protein
VLGRGRLAAVLALAGALALGPPALSSADPGPGTTTGKSRPSGAARPDPTEQLARASADLLKATRNYQASLERLLAIYESDLARNTALVEERWAQFAKGLVSRREIEEVELARMTAEANVAETRQWIDEANRLFSEATLSEQLSRLPALGIGGFESTAVFVRYNGAVKSALAEASKIQRFFVERFGRPLPVSAWGQTALHDRIGFDHRHALDVAVHPDSVEGRALAEFLRAAGISFVAFRQAVPGAATGAHFHIGEPSRRIVVPVKR